MTDNKIEVGDVVTSSHWHEGTKRKVINRYAQQTHISGRKTIFVELDSAVVPEGAEHPNMSEVERDMHRVWTEASVEKVTS